MNTQEYERLAEKYLDCIYRVAVNGCKHHADAEDVVQEDGRVYVKDNSIKVDITEDLADGQADVCYEKDGKTYRYVIEESPSVPGAYDYYLVEE